MCCATLPLKRARKFVSDTIRVADVAAKRCCQAAGHARTARTRSARGFLRAACGSSIAALLLREADGSGGAAVVLWCCSLQAYAYASACVPLSSGIELYAHVQ